MRLLVIQATVLSSFWAIESMISLISGATLTVSTTSFFMFINCLLNKNPRISSKDGSTFMHLMVTLNSLSLIFNVFFEIIVFIRINTNTASCHSDQTP